MKRKQEQYVCIFLNSIKYKFQVNNVHDERKKIMYLVFT